MTASLPPVVYRITREAFAPSTAEALSGIGGLKDDGRWHSVGRPILYSSSSSSLCLLERLEQQPARLLRLVG